MAKLCRFGGLKASRRCRHRSINDLYLYLLSLHFLTIGVSGFSVSLPNYFAAEVAAVYDEDAEMFAAQMVDPVVDYLAALAGGSVARVGVVVHARLLARVVVRRAPRLRRVRARAPR